MFANDERNTLVMLLAGGQGERLYPLTRDRAKPAVPFGGIYRIIDFTLSNCLNSGLRRINVLTQYKSFSLQRHLQFGWSIFRPELSEYMNVIPPQQRSGEHWYLGTADAIYQNIYSLQREKPKHVLILSGDHVYKMNYGHMIEYHVSKGADMTIACFAVPVKMAAKQLGVLAVDRDSRLIEFQEKPECPAEMPDRKGIALCSMGVYLFKTEALVREVAADAKRDSSHDFGKDIIPEMVGKKAALFAYEFKGEDATEIAYWRDIGTIDAYHDSNIDLVQPKPLINLFDTEWPIRTWQPPAPPAKTIGRGVAVNSLVSHGCVINDGRVESSVLSPSVRIGPGADVRDCVVLDEVVIGAGARIRRAVIDKRTFIPPGAVIGYEPARDRARFTMSPNGVAVIPTNIQIDVE